MEEKKCRRCGELKPLTDYYPDKHNSTGRSAQCKYCHGEYHKKWNMKSTRDKKWTKTNKNHYPDSEWVWQQLEQNVGSEEFYRRLDKKYELKKHGNEGKKHKQHKNPWDKRRNAGG